MNALLVALGGLGMATAGFVAAEYAARAWLRRRGRAFVWAPLARTRMIIDRETLPTLDPVVEHRINADGERGDTTPPDAKALFRVLVAGGSAAECWFVDQVHSWPNVLQDTLNVSANQARLGVRGVHVGNIARSLVTARHVDAILARVLPHYEHMDAIVLMVGVSDVLMWMQQGTPDELEEGPIPSSSLFAQHPDGPFGWSPKSLGLRRIASHWNRKLRRPIEVRERAGKRLADARRMRQCAREVVRDVPDPGAMIRGFERAFTSLIRRAKSKARHVLVVRQPWLEREFTPEEERLLWSFGAGRPYAGEVTRYYAREVGWELHRLVDARVADIARQAGVEQVELMSVVPGDFVHYYDDHHHTPRGCQVIGRVVAQALVEAVERARSPGGGEVIEMPVRAAELVGASNTARRLRSSG